MSRLPVSLRGAPASAPFSSLAAVGDDDDLDVDVDADAAHDRDSIMPAAADLVYTSRLHRWHDKAIVLCGEAAASALRELVHLGGQTLHATAALTLHLTFHPGYHAVVKNRSGVANSFRSPLFVAWLVRSAARQLGSIQTAFWKKCLVVSPGPLLPTTMGHEFVARAYRHGLLRSLPAPCLFAAHGLGAAVRVRRQ